MSITGWDGVTLTVEAGFSPVIDQYSVWDGSFWDTATWGPDLAWTDVTGDLRSFETFRGRRRVDDRYEAGTATLVLGNLSGDYSPANSDSPYWDATTGTTTVRPWRPFRIRAAYDGVTYPVYYGYALSFQESYAKGQDNVVTIPLIDEFGRLAAFAGVAQSSQGAGELSGFRVHRILNNAGNTATRDVDLGVYTLAATDLSENALEDLFLTADSEGGAVYVGADGAIVFDSQGAIVEQERSTVAQGFYTDADGGGLVYYDAVTEYTGDSLINEAAYQRAGATSTQIISNETSKALYGTRRDARSDFVCETDDQLVGLAGWKVSRFAEPEQRIASIEVRPQSNPSSWYPQVLGRLLRDLVRVQCSPRGSYTLDQYAFVDGITHSVTSDLWVTQFSFSDASPYIGVGTWDSAVWDTTRWFI
jgi:hypothetical protein